MVEALGARVDVPVDDAAEIVAGGIGSDVFGKLLAEAEVGRAVEAGHETVDYGLGDQVEAVEMLARTGGIEEALQHLVMRPRNKWTLPSIRIPGLKPVGRTIVSCQSRP